MIDISIRSFGLAFLEKSRNFVSWFIKYKARFFKFSVFTFKKSFLKICIFWTNWDNFDLYGVPDPQFYTLQIHRNKVIWQMHHFRGHGGFLHRGQYFSKKKFRKFQFSTAILKIQKQTIYRWKALRFLYKKFVHECFVRVLVLFEID